MNHYDITYIISAERANLTSLENDLRTEKLERDLYNLGAGFKIVLGCYQGTKENSFVVQGLKDASIVELLRKYGQDCALKLDSSRHADSIQANGDIISLGQFKAVSEANALKLANYTFDAVTSQYFVIK